MLELANQASLAILARALLREAGGKEETMMNIDIYLRSFAARSRYIHSQEDSFIPLKHIY